MSSPNALPNPQDPSEQALFSAEFDAHIDLMVQLHRYHEHTEDSDAIMDDRVIALNEGPTPPIDSKLYIWRRSSEALKDYLYDEMEYKPFPGTDTAVWTNAIYVRFPRLKGEKFTPFADDSGVVTPQDILIEVNGDRYLLNDHMIAPYPDGEALDFSDEELVAPTRPRSEKPNVYSVPDEFQLAAPYLSATMLHKMLLEDSKSWQREDR